MESIVVHINISDILIQRTFPTQLDNLLTDKARCNPTTLVQSHYVLTRLDF
jgi:hypothetical protein